MGIDSKLKLDSTLTSAPKYSGEIRSIAIIFAMEGEAAPLIARLGLTEVQDIEGAELGLRAFSGQVGSLRVYVSVNGKDPKHLVDNIGTEISALNAFHTINKFHPSILLNAGTAGGFKAQGTVIGDVYFGEGAVVNHDHRISLPGFYEYGVGTFDVLALATLPEKMGAKRGIITTGNSLDMTPADAEIISRSGAAVKEMEAAAIARISERKNTPFIAVKVITDFADQSNNHEEFQTNYIVACNKLGATLELLIKYLSEGKKIEEL